MKRGIHSKIMFHGCRNTRLKNEIARRFATAAPLNSILSSLLLINFQAILIGTLINQ